MIVIFFFKYGNGKIGSIHFNWIFLFFFERAFQMDKYDFSSDGVRIRYQFHDRVLLRTLNDPNPLILRKVL